ncbi:hypothetical protein [Hafnia paralvei]|uniref:hypothetical protein n=1 Tax=Hafnia paralvei TaxID=546367 RepID=UPI0018F084C7|nr:hypothetical protein [Hafnia paralvei]MBW2958935.1 hypothetical protein [Hafnia paralvei]
MKNRKAKILLLYVHKNCYPRQWLNISNRRMVLFSLGGVTKEGHQFKNSAAQNRWINHVRYL